MVPQYGAAGTTVWIDPDGVAVATATGRWAKSKPAKDFLKLTGSDGFHEGLLKNKGLLRDASIA